MVYHFIKFNGVYPRGDSKIGINKSGLIRLSAGFCHRTNILRYKNVVLYYDKKNTAVALKFTNNKEEGILKVTKDRTGGTVSAISFIKANNLGLKDYSGRFDVKKTKIQGIGEVFIINLSKK
jgi:hypothetical protein